MSRKALPLAQQKPRALAVGAHRLAGSSRDGVKGEALPWSFERDTKYPFALSPSKGSCYLTGRRPIPSTSSGRTGQFLPRVEDGHNPS
jgi:hypothetical protein